jgi:FkbM family methyltransferase
MEIDRLLSRFTRKTSNWPVIWQLTERWRKHYTLQYQSVSDPWVTIDDFDRTLKLRLDRSAYLGGLLYWRGYQELGELRLLNRILSPEMVVFDVGANQGEYAVFMAKRVMRGRLLAFEPVPLIYQQLTQNIELNSFSNVITFNYGLMDEIGDRPMYTSDDHEIHGSFNEGLASVFASDYRRDPVAQLSFRTLDAVVEEQKLSRIDLIKIDVEGAELYVLQGALETLRRYHPLLLIEVNAEAFAIAGYTAQDLTVFLDQLGYQFALISATGITAAISAEQMPKLCNILCEYRAI